MDDTIHRFNVPVDQHGFVARQFLRGKIASLVLRIATKSPDKVLHKEQIFNIVDASIKGSTPNLISCGEKYLKAAALQIESTEVLREIKSLTQCDDGLLNDLPFRAEEPQTTIPNGAVRFSRPTTPIPNVNGKRTLPLAEKQTVMLEDRRAKGAEVTSGKAYSQTKHMLMHSWENEPSLKSDPFGFLGRINLSDKPTEI